MIELADKSSKVIVVGDEPRDRKLLEVYLTNFDLQVISCANPEKAISELFINWPFVAAMFTDYDLPVMTGDHLALMARQRIMELPICIASASDFHPEQLEYFEHQGYYLLRKPVTLERFKFVISMISQENHPSYTEYYFQESLLRFS